MPAPLPFTGAGDAPVAERAGPGAPWRLTQRSDAEVVVVDIAREPGATPAAEVRFPAPWPRADASYAVSPTADLAVFAGPDAVWAVDRAGDAVWEVSHPARPSWSGGGSVGFAADGKTVWVHVVAGGKEEWLVVDPADGTVLARAETGTSAAGSVHVPHPDPGQMGLSIGEGQDGAPLRWGRWNGRTLTVDSYGADDLVLLAVSPGGGLLLAVDHDQNTVTVHRAGDGSVVGGVPAAEVPAHPDADPADEADDPGPCFDYAGGFVDEDTALVGTVESDDEHGAGRHWLLDTARPALIGQLRYPLAISGYPQPLGDGTWCTASPEEGVLHHWTRA
ncbi:hypothetical protein [Streptomyces sp. NPDC058953]|uniref:hypothetical protein n=1 Tax=Streptomyces sp. NPDC058953 TaxID=3346676 RepID=UPI0036C84F1E